MKRFGEISPLWQNFDSLWGWSLYLTKCSTNFGKNIFAKRQILFFVNGQILRKELIISGHTAAQLDPHFRINSDLQIMLNYGCSRSLVRSSLFIFTFSLNYSDEKTFLWRKLRDEVGDQLSTALWRLIAIISSVPIGYSIFYSQSERSKPA